MTTIMIGADSMNRTQTMNLVIALGGNALTPPGGTSRASSPDGAANVIADLVELGYNIVVTHGNGPQVGYALLKDVAAPHKVPRLSLTYLGAQTEGELGSLVALAIRRALEHKNLAIPVTAIVTHAIVNPSDPDALTSTKPIGPVFLDEEAAEKAAHITGLVTIEDRNGKRLAVPSPKPCDVLEKDAIRTLLGKGHVVVAAGGGGIPVTKVPSGGYGEFDAVIDKDRTSAYLAGAIQADHLIILTDIEGVYVDFKKPTQQFVNRATVGEMEAYLNSGAFGTGSMGPKVEAACMFVRVTGNSAFIGHLEQAAEVIAGNAGTEVISGGERL